MRLLQSKTRCRSSWGTPSRSAITCNGSSAEISVTKSHSPFSLTASMMLLAWRRMVSWSWLTRRGVKPLFTSSRYRVCMGGSMFSIISRCWASISSSDSMNSAVRRLEENSWLSRLTATRSA